MRKFLTTALAAATAAGAIAATAAPAEARPHHYYRHHHGGGDAVAAAAVAGIAGLALGAALSDHDGRSHYSYSTGYRYDPRYDSYYGRSYYPRERVCITQDRVWDPYIGRHVYVERRYPC
jgi:hypothetical protein